MPSHLHPNEIGEFFDLYHRVVEKGARDSVQVKALQYAIQKMDFEFDPTRDDFMLTPGGEKHFRDGVTGRYDELTEIAANQVYGTLLHGIATGKLIYGGAARETLCREADAFQPKLTHREGLYGYVNLQDILTRSQGETDGKVSIYNTGKGDRDPNSRQYNSRINPCDPGGEVGKAANAAYENLVVHVRDDPVMQALLNKPDWNAKDRADWDRELGTHVVRECWNRKPLQSRVTNVNKEDFAQIDAKTNFFCYDQAVIGGLLAQKLENQFLAAETSYFKSPTTYLVSSNYASIGVDFTQGPKDPFGHHAVAASSKSGVMISNFSAVAATIQPRPHGENFLGYLNGAPYRNGRAMLVLSKMPGSQIDSVHPDQHFRQNEDDDPKRKKLFVEVLAIKDESAACHEAVRRNREEKIAALLAPYELGGVETTQVQTLSQPALDGLIQRLGTHLYAHEVRLTNQPGQVDVLEIDGKPHFVTLGQEIKTRTRHTF